MSEQTIPHDYSHCMLCPRACGVNRRDGQRGACASSAVMTVARVGLHAWEEPPISGNVGSGTIFFTGCSLACSYCQNSAISHGGCGQQFSVDMLVQSCLSLQKMGAMNVNMVTPTHFAPSVRLAIGVAKDRGLRLPVVWNTSGYETVDAIRANSGYVDVYLTDYKYADSNLAASLSGVADYADVAAAAIGAMIDQVGAPTYDEFGGVQRMVSGVVVRHLVLPGHVDESIEAVRRVHEEFGDSVRLSIMNQYTPVLPRLAQQGNSRAAACLRRFPELARCVSDSEYEAVLDFADTIGIEDYFWQQGVAASESFIPDFCCD
ncbi:radical SAM protein [Adlercreutzia sp. ZJ304]|uniref:radical SAM protein n=1 Tax=Adlercreutzia sp. ZJ304 TaxID=2709791 RepID=UPI0013ECE212|nr:radical SAM protein [Adlercreutzia sp. ZJ304]